MKNLSDTAPSRPQPKNLGKTSFLSQVNSCNSVKEDDVIKTKDEFCIESNTLNNRFIFGLIIFSLTSMALSVKWLITSQKSLVTECAYCKLAFLTDFYMYALANVILSFIYFRNLNAPEDKMKGFSSNFLASSRAIMAMYVSQTTWYMGLFLAQSFLCTNAADSVLLNTFILALIQTTLQLLLNCICSMRITRFYEQSKQIEQNQANTKKTIEIFNASFCLNETKSEINLYPRRSMYSREKINNYSLNRTNNIGNSIFMQPQIGNLSNIHSISTDITKLGSMLSGDSIMDFKKRKSQAQFTHRRKFNHVKDFDIYMPDRMEIN